VTVTAVLDGADAPLLGQSWQSPVAPTGLPATRARSSSRRQRSAMTARVRPP